VELVIVRDDVALGEESVRRGLAGTVLVHKISGAAAAKGAPLEEVVAVAQAVANAVGTIGVGLGPCILPGAEAPGFTLGENEMELGLGIHGEPGVCKQELMEADPLVDLMLQNIVSVLGIASGPSIVLINGLVRDSHQDLFPS
jgi:dihydroxyacetone kinase